MSDAVRFNPFTEEFRDDPYAVYSDLWTRAPIVWSEHLTDGWPEQWVVTGFDEATCVLREKLLSKDICEAEKLGVQTGYENADTLRSLMAHWATVRDGTEHSRLRKQVNKPFASRTVEGIRESVREKARALVRNVVAGSEIDLMDQFAVPLALDVITDLVGITVENRHEFAGWLESISDAVDVDQRPEILAKGTRAAEELIPFLELALPTGSAHGLLGSMVDDGVDSFETIAAVAFLLTAGYVNTANLFCSSVLALLRHPEELARLRADRSLLVDAVNECSRYDSPVQMVLRYAFDDVEVNGTPIRKGQRVLVVLGAVNRDPAKFSSPDTLDITREETKHIAFGFGLHSCLGVALAKMTCEEGINALLDSAGEIHLLDKMPPMKESAGTRGVERLMVELR